MTAIGATPPTATRAEPTDIIIGNFAVNGAVTTDIDMTGLRRSNASYEIESINNDVNLKTNGIVGAKLAQNGDFSVHTSDLFTKKSNGFTGFGTSTPGEKVEVFGDGANIELNHATTSSLNALNFSEAGSALSLVQGIGSAFATVARRNNLEIISNSGNVILQRTGGNVGIGLDDPTDGGANVTTLEIEDSITARLLLSSTGGSQYGMFSGSSSQFAIRDFTAGVNRIEIDTNGNIGFNGTNTFGVSAVGSFAISNGTAPTTSIANQIEIFSVDIASAATLGFRTEAAVAVDIDETKFSDKLPVKINGTDYFIMLTQT